MLPHPKVVGEYADSVPEDFIFSIKVPNSITLTHRYKKQRSDSLTANPHFLSIGVAVKNYRRAHAANREIGGGLFSASKRASL